VADRMGRGAIGHRTRHSESARLPDGRRGGAVAGRRGGGPWLSRRVLRGVEGQLPEPQRSSARHLAGGIPLLQFARAFHSRRTSAASAFRTTSRSCATVTEVERGGSRSSFGIRRAQFAALCKKEETFAEAERRSWHDLRMVGGPLRLADPATGRSAPY
jgi:hypothetical protein